MLSEKQILKTSGIIWKAIENIHDEEKHQACDADACDICLNSYPIRVAVWAEAQSRKGAIWLTDRELSFFVGTQGYAGNGKFTSPSETDKGRLVSGALLLQKLCNEYDRRMAVGKRKRRNRW